MEHLETCYFEAVDPIGFLISQGRKELFLHYDQNTSF
jgi:hypothetical protein